VNEATIVPFVSNQVLNCLTDVCTDLWLLWWCSSTIMVFAHCWPLMLFLLNLRISDVVSFQKLYALLV
jgi:hypothetical protein